MRISAGVQTCALPICVDVDARHKHETIVALQTMDEQDRFMTADDVEITPRVVRSVGDAGGIFQRFANRLHAEILTCLCCDDFNSLRDATGRRVGIGRSRRTRGPTDEIGRATWRERGCQYVEIPGVA